ncbi:MAG: hypothetical protein Q8R92_05225 [Deltaproteobacteria bacterium]|nr:hypothetical protein [Deltaproteobacteria bacterium]
MSRGNAGDFMETEADEDIDPDVVIAENEEWRVTMRKSALQRSKDSLGEYGWIKDDRTWLPPNLNEDWMKEICK